MCPHFMTVVSFRESKRYYKKTEWQVQHIAIFLTSWHRRSNNTNLITYGAMVPHGIFYTKMIIPQSYRIARPWTCKNIITKHESKGWKWTNELNNMTNYIYAPVKEKSKTEKENNCHKKNKYSCNPSQATWARKIKPECNEKKSHNIMPSIATDIDIDGVLSVGNKLTVAWGP